MRDELRAGFKGHKIRLSGMRNSEAPVYEGYQLTRRERSFLVLKGISFAVLSAVLFYNNALAALLFLPFWFLYKKREINTLIEKKKFKLNTDFSDAIACLSGILEGGSSIENAVEQTYSDLLITFDKDSAIMKELKIVSTRIRNNIRIEDAFLDMARRTDIEDVKSFADVFATAKRTGGNIIAIIRETSSVIRTKTEVARELRTVMASKKLESDIMRTIPYLMLIYLRISSPDLLMPLYSDLKGVMFMSLMLALYLGMSVLTTKIVRIRI